MSKLLRDVMPQEFLRNYQEDRAYKFVDVPVSKEHYSHVTRWPGTHKNVHFWVELENGKAVGWNESPSRGWSFPVITHTSSKAT